MATKRKNKNLEQPVMDKEYLDLKKQTMKQNLEQGRSLNVITTKLINQNIRYRTIGFWVSLILTGLSFLLIFILIAYMLNMAMR